MAELRNPRVAELRNCGTAELWKCGMKELRLCGIVKLRNCGSVEWCNMSSECNKLIAGIGVIVELIGFYYLEQLHTLPCKMKEKKNRACGAKEKKKI